MHLLGARSTSLRIAVFALVTALTAPSSLMANAAVPALPSGVPAPPADSVRIGIGRSQTSADVSAPGGLLIIDQEGIHWQTEPGQTVQVLLSDGAVQVTGLARRFASLRLVPVPHGLTEPDNPASSPINPIGYKGRTYRGEIEAVISPRDGKLSIVNVVGLEEYLFGVIPREMPYNWPLEALKAQAVAARTYAIQSMGPTAKFADEGFDMVDNTLSQEYGGIGWEYTATNMAVLSTRNQVITYGDRPVVTYYHSSSGGYTENNEVIWTGGSPVPYLRGVMDFDNIPGNKRYSWIFRYSSDDFARELREAHYDVGSVLGVKPSGQIGASGRPSHWQVASRGSNPVTLTGQQLRSALGLPSPVRTITVRSAAENAHLTRTYMPAETVHVVGAGLLPGSRLVMETNVMGATGTVAAPSAFVVVTGQTVLEEAGVVIEGGGFGHAIGMSQWGARGMAQQGKNYGEILTHYYQGTKVANR